MLADLGRDWGQVEKGTTEDEMAGYPPPPIPHPRDQENVDFSLPLGLALGSPIFPSGCEGKLGVALESLQGLIHVGLVVKNLPANAGDTSSIPGW